MRRIRRGIIALLLTGAIIFSGCSGTWAKKSTLVVLEADSLMIPFAQIQTEFEKTNPTNKFRLVFCL